MAAITIYLRQQWKEIEKYCLFVDCVARLLHRSLEDKSRFLLRIYSPAKRVWKGMSSIYRGISLYRSTLRHQRMWQAKKNNPL